MHGVSAEDPETRMEEDRGLQESKGADGACREAEASESIGGDVVKKEALDNGELRDQVESVEEPPRRNESQ